jgi:hypothetical protein
MIAFRSVYLPSVPLKSIGSVPVKVSPTETDRNG